MSKAIKKNLQIDNMLFSALICISSVTEKMFLWESFAHGFVKGEEFFWSFWEAIQKKSFNKEIFLKVGQYEYLIFLKLKIRKFLHLKLG